MRWVHMAGAEITMPQPYGLVCEVRRTADGYRIKFTFDTSAFTADEATKGANEMVAMVKRMLDNKDTGVRELVSA